MFVHSVASLHRHEYSPPIDPLQSNSISRRSPLARAAFSTPLITRSSPVSDRPAPIIRRIDRPLSDSRLHEHTVRFQGIESDKMDEDARSTTSDGSNTTGTASRHKRRSYKPSSNYHFAYPAPTKLQTQRLLQVRPKLLLQLQYLPNGSRPVPYIDVLPSTVVIPRLIKRFPRMFRGKSELGAMDLMVVRAESYDTEDEDKHAGVDSDEEGYSNRELLAVICQARKDPKGSIGRAEIVMADGTLWEAKPQDNGKFEFVSVDEEGNKKTARWVKKSKQHNTDFFETLEQANDSYSFSLIDPTQRRHPILANLSSTKLNIPETYTPISSSLGSFPPASADKLGDPGRLSIFVDETLKLLIQTTAIWVALRKGWCPYFKYTDSMATLNPTRPRAASLAGRSLSASMSSNNGLSSPSLRVDTPESNNSTFSGVGDKIRRSCALGSSPASPSEKATVPQRSVSTGAAFLQKQTAARRGTHPVAVASGSEADSVPPLLRRAGTDTDVSTPPPNGINLSSSCTTTPDTPTRLPRRPQSTLIPSSAQQNGNSRDTQSVDIRARNISPDLGKKQKSVPKAQKMSRWKSISNFFRKRKVDSS